MTICIFLYFVSKNHSNFGVELLSRYCPFYFTGFFIGKYKEKINHKQMIGMCTIVGWLVSVPFWRRGQETTLIRYLPESLCDLRYAFNRLF